MDGGESKQSSDTTTQITETTTIGDIGITGQAGVDLANVFANAGVHTVEETTQVALKQIDGATANFGAMAQVFQTQSEGLNETQQEIAQTQSQTAQALGRASGGPDPATVVRASQGISGRDIVFGAAALTLALVLKD